jgi:hypothetical protein
MWTYEQATGRLLRPGGELLEVGYSGFADGKNNPLLETEANVGPVPRGLWYFGFPFSSKDHGPFCLRLFPDPATNTHGRSGFLVHGDSKQRPGSASRGCVVVSRDAREEMWDSDDHRLLVV